MRRVQIFDTTLRDGEQSPGISLSVEEKMEIAHQLARLEVDVIEAGFPITSEGDFESVSRIAAEVKGPTVAGLARIHEGDIERAWEAVQWSDTAPHPHLRRHLRPAHRAPDGLEPRRNLAAGR